jgi:hypothetical protein
MRFTDLATFMATDHLEPPNFPEPLTPAP